MSTFRFKFKVMRFALRLRAGPTSACPMPRLPRSPELPCLRLPYPFLWPSLPTASAYVGPARPVAASGGGDPAKCRNPSPATKTAPAGAGTVSRPGFRSPSLLRRRWITARTRVTRNDDHLAPECAARSSTAPAAHGSQTGPVAAEGRQTAPEAGARRDRPYRDRWRHEAVPPAISLARASVRVVHYLAAKR